ncbi:DUF6119 family protein [Streptomyces sp. NPDC093221]|uniref:DUF6119 family protein n=1 Tax=Streptomyces sp. NPDC093221 TaxID=3366032 RepID=UPI00380081D5
MSRFVPEPVPPSIATSNRTLYRLTGVEPTVEAMLDCIPADKLDDMGAEIQVLSHYDVPAIALCGSFAKEESTWCAGFSRLTGWEVREPSRRGAALIMLAVDGEVYVVTFGDGFRLVPGEFKDRRFGLRFVIRSVDPDDIRAAVSRTPGQGRTDISMLPGGAPIGVLALDTFTKLVDKLTGRLNRPELTVALSGDGRVRSAEGGSGLRLPYGADPAALISDIRIIAKVSREELPLPELEFVESVTPVQEQEMIASLNLALDAALGTLGGVRATATVPSDSLDDMDQVRAVGVRFGTREDRHFSDAFDLDYVLGRLRFHRPGHRFPALEDGQVTLYSDDRARPGDIIRTDPLALWIEADLLLDDGRRFVFLEARWHEFDQAYLGGLAITTRRVITPTPSVDLPPWRDGDDEHAYNKSVQRERPGFLCLDRKNVRTPLHRKNGVEVCDLLAPDNTLVMVKRASGSDALSHLFSQGIVAVEALLNQPEARAGFAAKVEELGDGRRLPEGFLPHRVVFAILLKGHDALTVDTLYPFAQVALAHAARTLRSYGVEVEVVGIPPEGEADAGQQAA